MGWVSSYRSYLLQAPDSTPLDKPLTHGVQQWRSQHRRSEGDPIECGRLSSAVSAVEWVDRGQRSVSKAVKSLSSDLCKGDAEGFWRGILGGSSGKRTGPVTDALSTRRHTHRAVSAEGWSGRPRPGQQPTQ